VKSDTRWPHLEIGEREAIGLALQIGAWLILMDDAAGRNAVSALADLHVTGTIGVLYRAATERQFPDATNMASAFEESILLLKATNFFFNAKLDAAISKLSFRLHQFEATSR